MDEMVGIVESRVIVDGLAVSVDVMVNFWVEKKVAAVVVDVHGVVRVVVNGEGRGGLGLGRH